MDNDGYDFDMIVIGGGLGGLAAALGGAKAGLRVCVLEASARWGGRGASDSVEGFVFNQGPHAVYPASWAMLDALGVKVRARVVSAEGSMLDDGERLLPIPGTLSSFLSADWLSAKDRLDLARAFSAVTFSPARPAQTLTQWLDARALTSNVRALMETLLRIATYGASPDVADADAAIAQLRSVVLGGVRYVDGGWQSIADAMVMLLEKHGAALHVRTRVSALHRLASSYRVETNEGAFVAPHVVLAASPQLAGTLLRPLDAHVEPTGAPLTAACLELGLARLPEGAVGSAFGTKETTYISVHSKTARLAPEGAAMVHAARYLDDQAPSPADDRRVIECALDRAMPGWQSLVLHARYTPRALVQHARVEAPSGLAGRPSIRVDALTEKGVMGVYRVGDWVGPKGMLLDAVLFSARTAAAACATRTMRRAA